MTVLNFLARFSWCSTQHPSLGCWQHFGIDRCYHKTRLFGAVSWYLIFFAYITHFSRYTASGNKRILLKKLGSPSCFFDFVEGEKLLLVVCAANPSSGLPEAYHLIDTNGNEPCSTTCRPSYLPQAKCFTIAELPDRNGRCLLTGKIN
jgi:hypothetical protein